MLSRSRLVLGLAGSMTILLGQSTKVEDLAPGKVLVMERQAPDPVFAQSVILLVHYDEDGVLGVMLNQPARVPLSKLRELPGTGGRSDPIYAGGPVEVGTVTALMRAPRAVADAMHVTADVYAVQTRNGLEAALKASKGPADFRVYLGYCGWTMDQLRNEVRLGSWYIFDHGERFAFDAEPDTLWKRLIDRTAGQFAFTVRPAAGLPRLR